MIDIDELERLARAATPGGKWFQVQDKVYRLAVADGEPFSHGFVCETKGGPVERARFIAAANPAAVLELTQAVRWSIGFRCPDCLGFASTSQDVIAHTESCPYRRAVEAQALQLPPNKP